MQPTGISHSSSRSKWSRTDLSNLRLSPLTTREPAPVKQGSKKQEPNDEYPDSPFTRSHSSYLQGKSAPTTPGILSRSSSRRHLGGGLSRRGSLYEDNAQDYPRIEVVRDSAGDVRVEVGSGQISKSKSEAALLVQRSKLARKGILSPEKQRRKHARSRTGGTNTPRVKVQTQAVEDDWITRTGAATNALLQESKGQSWMASRESSTSLTHLQDTTDEDDDEGYEEMAAMTHSRLPSGETSPVSTRASRWGSRYGSRTASRRTSRRGSISGTAGSRTPVAAQDGATDYFEPSIDTNTLDADEEDDESSHDEETVARLTESRSFGLGGLVDKIMNFNLFKVEEREESTEDESTDLRKTEESAEDRVESEAQRRAKAKEKLVKPAAPLKGGVDDEQTEGGWSDAAWLLSVASKAIL